MAMPMLGIGVGGTGGGPLGGWVTCAWGVPMYGDIKVAAGRLGKTAAIGAVRLAKPTSSACLASPKAPIMAPAVCCKARRVRAVFCPAVGGGPPGVAGALMLLHALPTWATELDHCCPTPNIALGVL